MSIDYIMPSNLKPSFTMTSFDRESSHVLHPLLMTACRVCNIAYKAIHVNASSCWRVGCVSEIHSATAWVRETYLHLLKLYTSRMLTRAASVAGLSSSSMMAASFQDQ